MSTLSTLDRIDTPQRNARLYQAEFDDLTAVVRRPAPVATPAVASSGAVRLTRRGQVVLVVAFLGLALALMTLFGGWATASRDSGPAASVRVVTVAPGDTLYALAGRVAEPGHVRDMVQRIIDLNSLSGATLQPGQRIAVPRG